MIPITKAFIMIPKTLLILVLLHCLLISVAQKKQITIDKFFNSETKINNNGVREYYRYTWENKDLRSYSIWGEIIKSKEYELNEIAEAPNESNLRDSKIYVICDPDNYRDNPEPNFMNEKHAANIYQWVKEGGILIMFANDSANADLLHFNILATKFNMKFTDTLLNPVKKDISVGKIIIPEKNEIFPTGRILYMKEICTIELQKKAVCLLTHQKQCIMAMTKVGKGYAIAISDPWIYNEYIVNDRLDASFQNQKAAEEFTNWLLDLISNK